ncbi:MAG TPA: sigma-70 family RNA polymerase sigma factor [Thermoanaerobaculia bacterium]|nr:sigma-70 family RNA polymerase sigma factor [Thermoanaerobaculia bacterium]
MDDRSLVRRLRAGEEQAFEEFFALYFQPLYRFALSRVDRRTELARDMAQATICKALEKLHLYRGEAQLFTWMCAICRFEISAYRKSERRDAAGESSRFDPHAEETMARLATDADDPERELLRGEVSRLVHQTVDELPPRYAQALSWKYTDGLPVSEIARRLGSSAKAAESLLTRARDAFRTRYSRNA